MNDDKNAFSKNYKYRLILILESRIERKNVQTCVSYNLYKEGFRINFLMNIFCLSNFYDSCMILLLNRDIDIVIVNSINYL